jgi:dipeptidyl aminopeptidase/acylaminoacyl peptidase
LEDVDVVLGAILTGAIGDKFVDRSRIGVIGHSRGGGVAIIKASEDPRIKAVAAWSTVARFDRYTEGQRKRWRAKGFLGSSTASSQSIFKVGTALLDDIETNAERLNIEQAVTRLQKPLLLIHGTADIPVPVDEARRLYDKSDKLLTDYVELTGVGHMYGARHPYKEPSPVMTHVLELTSAWFHKHL